ncbi:MAG: hypothetical protein AB1428_13085 [Bacteroidota bacterium]
MANKRADIVAAIVTKLGTIATTADYLTNIGLKASEWRTIPVGETDQFLTIRDTTDDLGAESLHGVYNEQIHALTIEVHIVATDQGTNASVFIRKAIADIYKAVGADDTFGLSYVMKTDPVKDEFDITQEERKAAGAVVTLAVQYRTTKWEN